MKKYIFIGNRFYVLKAMMELGCFIEKIFAVNNSYLSKELDRLNISYNVLKSKQTLIKELKESEYDVLVSNGCPYILPISELQNGSRQFINVHPSLLPDLKGKSPINGAILFHRRHGVTCHHMDDGIDTGKVIEQIEIDTDNISLNLLYLTSFMMEGEVFKQAYKNHFAVKDSINMIPNPIYYSRCENDYFLNKSDSNEKLVQRVNAFSINGQYARFIKDEHLYYVKKAVIISNHAVEMLYRDICNYTICNIYGNYLLYKHNSVIFELELTDVPDPCLKTGETLFE